MEKTRWQFYVETSRSEWLDQSQSDRDVCKTLTFVFRLITENIRASDLIFILRCHIKTCILQQLLQQKLYNAAFLLQNEENTSWKRVQIIVHSKTKTKIYIFTGTNPGKIQLLISCHVLGEWQCFSTVLWSPPLGGAIFIPPRILTCSWSARLYIRHTCKIVC